MVHVFGKRLKGWVGRQPLGYHALRVKRYQRFVLLATLQGWALFSIPLLIMPPEWKPFSMSFFGIAGRGILAARLSTIFQAGFEYYNDECP